MGYRYNPFTGNFDRVGAGSGAPAIETLTGDSGGAVGPDGSFNIDIIGNPDIDIVGTPGTSSFQFTNLTAWSKYVVDPTAGNSRFQTIQAAINQANTDGGGVVLIHPGAYTEDLTLYDGVHLVGAVGLSQNQGSSVSITGTHTPPSSGQVVCNSICFLSTIDAFSSAAAGTTHLALINCESAIQNGHLLNLPNWTGTLEIFDHNAEVAGAPFAINDGGINNTGGATVLGFTAGIGSGTNTMVLSGLSILQNINGAAPIDFQTGSNIAVENCIFTRNVTVSNNSTGYFRTCDFSPSTAVSAFIMNSSAGMEIVNSIINTSASNAINGTGGGTLTLGGINWIDSDGIAGTVTFSKIPLEGGVGYFDNLSFDRGSSTLTSNGQIWIGSGSGNPAPANLTGGTGINVTNGANSITLTTHGSVSTSFITNSGTAIPASGALTIAGGTNVNTAGSGSTVTVNLDTNISVGTIDCTQTTIDPAAATDSFLQFDESTTGKWRIGNDATDDSYRISQGSSLGTNDTQIITSAGEITFPLTPAFLATHSVAQNNVTGNGTAATVNFTTEVFDQNSDYDGTNTFTAPVTGRYSLGGALFINDAATATQAQLNLSTSNRTYVGLVASLFSTTDFQLVVNALADMDAADTAVLQGVASGIGADTADFPIAANNTYFYGSLEC